MRTTIGVPGTSRELSVRISGVMLATCIVSSIAAEAAPGPTAAIAAARAARIMVRMPAMESPVCLA